ncbi:MAG TPA: hypothetical protein G4N92_02280 [Anaerolineae bacterium]|nr:hypothetical protein [Anaerolineae bacterium]
MSNIELFDPRMPEVDVRPDIEQVFVRARQEAEKETVLPDGTHLRRVIIVTPGRLLVAKDSFPPGSMPQKNLEVFESLVPSRDKRRIAVIAYTYLEALKADIRKAIPSFDYLLGFAYQGHTVWVFEGHVSALEAGCRDADLLLVDSAMLPYLVPDWHKRAKKSMRNAIISTLARPGTSTSY